MASSPRQSDQILAPLPPKRIEIMGSTMKSATSKETTTTTQSKTKPSTSFVGCEDGSHLNVKYPRSASESDSQKIGGKLNSNSNVTDDDDDYFANLVKDVDVNIPNLGMFSNIKVVFLSAPDFFFHTNEIISLIYLSDLLKNG